MPAKTITATVSKIVQETPEIKTLRLEFSPEENFDLHPGQFINLILEAGIEGKTKKIVRSYSISSSPTKKNYVEITVKKGIPGGTAEHLHNLRIGDNLSFVAPFGIFYFREGMSKNIVLICGGSGIAPCMSMIRYITELKTSTTITLIYSNKTEKDIVFYNELKELAKINKNLKLVFTLTREIPKDWKNRKGRISKEIIKGEIDDIHSALFFVCGPKAFIENSIAILKSLDVEERNIIIEKWM